MYADCSRALRARSARSSRFDIPRPRRLLRADRSRPPRERLPPRADFPDFFEAARPLPCFLPAACVSNVVDELTKRRARRRLKRMNVTLGERFSFIGNSLEKVKTNATEAEQVKLSCFE